MAVAAWLSAAAEHGIYVGARDLEAVTNIEGVPVDSVVDEEFFNALDNIWQNCTMIVLAFLQVFIGETGDMQFCTQVHAIAPARPPRRPPHRMAAWGSRFAACKAKSSTY